MSQVHGSCNSDWRFKIDFLRFHFTALQLILVLLAAEALAIPGDSRPAILGVVLFAICGLSMTP